MGGKLLYGLFSEVVLPWGLLSAPKKNHTEGLLMKHALEKEVQEIMSDLMCPKSFICYKSGFERLCQAKDVGLKDYLACLEENPSLCPFSVSFGSLYICHCALRVFAFKKLGK